MTDPAIPSVTVPSARASTEDATAGRSPTFSFLTPAYRTEHVLGRMIDSVFAQTSGDWELVVVDNGRDDAIVAVVEPYLADPRVTLVRQDNQGAAGGTSAAARASRGRYLVPLNSDDAVEPEFCRRMAVVLAEAPDVAAVTCDAHLFADPDERRMLRTYLVSAGLPSPPDPHRPLRVADVVDGPCPYYTAAIRRDVWEELNGRSTDTPLVDDLDFWLRALLAGHDIRMIPEVLARFRIQAGSESRPTDPERAEDFENQRRLALSRAGEQSGDPETRAALERVLGRLDYQQAVRRARLAFGHGDMAAARRHVETAHALRPGPRTAALRVALRVAPGPLRLAHPAKRRVQAAVDHVRRFGWRRR